MSSLAATYSLACGVTLDRPQLNTTFFPLDHPIEKMILVHAFAGSIVEQNGQKAAAFSSKCYDYYTEVLALLSPILTPLGYKFYQIGGKDEPPLKGAEYLCGKTTIAQCGYLVKNCALLLANDSMWCHWRGACGGNLVELMGPTDKRNHGPHWYDPAKTIILESHRAGKKPSYAMAENPKTIGWIAPESAGQAVLDLLGISQSLTRTSYYIGPDYNATTFEIVPNFVPNPQLNIGVPLIRADLEWKSEESEKILAANLQVRKCGIITDHEINLNLLAQFRPQIVGLRIIVDKLTPQWIKQVRRIGIPIQALTREKDEKKLSQLRLDLYDACFFDVLTEPDKENLKREIEVYRNKKLDTDFNLDKLSFRTNHFLLSSGKIHLSVPHWRACKSVETVEQNSDGVIDCEEFWKSQREHYYFTP